jgi:hypothetical protein
MMADVFQARVREGRLVLDEPTDLPEGEVVFLQQVDAAVAGGDLSDEEREDLFQALDEAIESVRPPEDTELDDADVDADGRPTVPQPEAGTRE